MSFRRMTDTMGSRTDTVSELGSPGSPSSRPTISVLKTQRSVTGGTVFSKSKGSDITDTGDDHSATYVGCLSWNVEIINGRIHDRKTIYIDPWKGILFQQGQHSQKSWEVSHIEEATYISENSINVIIKHPSDILSKARIFSFPYGSHAAHFKNAIQQVNEFGEFLRIAYRSIVRSDHGHITKTLLFKALCEHDISVTEEEVESMIRFNTEATTDSVCPAIDFLHFFLIFTNTYVRTVKECLLEWLRKERFRQADTVGGFANAKFNDNGENVYVSNSELMIPELLPAEKLICNPVTNIRWSIVAAKMVGTLLYDSYNKSAESYLGNIYFTNYRIILVSSASRDTHLYGKPHSRHYMPDFFSHMSIPLNTIHRLQSYLPGALANSHTTVVPGVASPGPRADKHAVTNYNAMGAPTLLYILCKDCRTLKLSIYPGRLAADALSSSESNSPAGSLADSLNPEINNGMVACTTVADLIKVVQKHAFPLNFFDNPAPHQPNHAIDNFKKLSMSLFAFKYRGQYQENGWDLSDVLKDYVRQGILGMKEFRIIDNSSYRVCDTYPTHFVLPASLSTSYMYEIAGFRSKQRIPVVTYFHQPSQCVLVRAAQPLVGLLHRHCTEDVALLNWYRAREHATDDETKLYIFDLRSYAAAVGNGVGRGGGKEDVSLYICTELVHSNLENIHAIRNSFNLLCDVVAPGSGEEEIAYLYYTKLDESCWLKYIRAILDCSVKVAERIHLERTSVVVRCSDGWDRTPQVCSLVEIMLDPYYRTLEGIAVLIEKEWCGFGHKFHDRCGHAVNHATNPDEKSPIFVQFLDCVMQLVTQFPNSFEFNGFLLVFLADHVNSALFGNFLGNSDKERRVKLNVHRLTQSVWSHVYEHSERFVNEDFEPYFDCIWPSTSVKQVRLWDRFYGRWDHKLHPSSLNAYDQWHDDWGNGFESVDDTLFDDEEDKEEDDGDSQEDQESLI